MKFLKYMVLVAYLFAAIILTFCMFNVNSHGDVKIDNMYLIGMREKVSSFSKSSLVYGKLDLKNITTESEVLYYSSNQIKAGVVNEIKESSTKSKTYVVNKNTYVSSEDIIGSVSSTKSIAGLGVFFAFAISSTGYLLCVLFPIALIFLFQIFALVKARKNA